MKKIRRAEFLLAVAIITSAAVLQVREHMLRDPVQKDEATLSCGAFVKGLAPAACTSAHSARSVDGPGQARQAPTQLWV